MNSIVKSFLSAEFVFTLIRMSTPIIYASMAALVSRKAGMTNITIDGTMLTSALVGVLVSAYTQNLFLAMIAGMLSGMFIGGFMAFFHIKMNTVLTLTGVAINLFTTGGTVFLLYAFAGDKGSSSALQSLTFPVVNLPIIQNIPFIGTALSGHNVLTYFAFISVLVVYFFIYNTPLGLKIRAVGEYPKAAESVGQSSENIKILSLIIAGFFASLGGMFLSMGYVNVFTVNMTASRGFIGVAAEAIGAGRPVPVLLAALLFGAAQAVSNKMQLMNIPNEIVMVMPYIITLAVLILYGMKEAKDETNKKKRVNSLLKAEDKRGLTK